MFIYGYCIEYYTNYDYWETDRSESRNLRNYRLYVNFLDIQQV